MNSHEHATLCFKRIDRLPREFDNFENVFQSRLPIRSCLFDPTVGKDWSRKPTCGIGNMTAQGL